MSENVLLSLNTMIASGEILFVSNRRDSKTWIQVYAFYELGGSLYAVTKDFAGFFRRVEDIPYRSFVACRAYYLERDSTIINIKGEVVAVKRNDGWTLFPPGMKLQEFSLRVQIDENTDNCGYETGNNCRHKNSEPFSGCSFHCLYQWFRSVFLKKCFASG